MNIKQHEIDEVLSSGTEIDLKIELLGNLLIIEKTRGSLDYIYWLLLIIGIPAYLFIVKPSAIGLTITLGLSLCFVYLIYDTLSATNRLIVDLARKELFIVSNTRVLKKEIVVPFEKITSATLAQKSFGRGQPAGRRLFIQTTDGRNIAAIDFRNAAIAEKVERVLSSIIKN